MKEIYDPHTIPPITEPMGKYWKQPSLSDVLIDDTHALMDEKRFMELAEYSASNPTGCYPGKAWRRHDGAFDEKFIRSGGKPIWKLCWFGFSKNGDPKLCSNNYRTVLFI